MIKKLKKPLAAVLALTMILSLFAGLNITSYAISSAMRFDVQQKGEYIYLSLYTGKGISNYESGEFIIEFDSDVLEYVSTTDPNKGMIDGTFVYETALKRDSNDKVLVGFLNMYDKYVSADKLLFTFKFKIKDSSTELTHFSLYPSEEWMLIDRYEWYWPDAIMIDVYIECTHETVEIKNDMYATCTTEGYTGDTYCAECGEKLKDGEIITAMGHSFGEWTVVTPATDTTEGLKERTCMACGIKEEEKIRSDGDILKYLEYGVEEDQLFITGCDKSISGDFEIPAEIEGNLVTVIGVAAFYKCTSLTSITIPDSVTSIFASAFEGCTSLTDITIPDSVTYISMGAFSSCTSLTDITIPDSVTYISMGAFEGCTSLTNITIPDSVTYIDEQAFGGCTSLTNITIPDSITSIKTDAFYGCTSLASITIPNSVTYIGYKALGYMYLDYDNYELIDGFVIYGEAGTEAERYAKDNGITFIALNDNCTHETVELKNIKAADCTTDGYTGDKYCTKCGEKLEAGTAIPATGHSFDEWIVVTPATDTTEGLKERTCSACGTKEEKAIPVVETVVPGEITFVDDSVKLDDDNMIATLGDKTTVDKFNSLVESGNVKIVDKDGNALDAKATIGTGCVVQSLDGNGNVVSEYTVLVPCDIDGNGKITAADARLALRISAKLENITGVYRTAADFDGDGNVKNGDARSILRKSINLI